MASQATQGPFQVQDVTEPERLDQIQSAGEPEGFGFREQGRECHPGRSGHRFGRVHRGVPFQM
jgi:hypothetical protein